MSKITLYAHCKPAESWDGKDAVFDGFKYDFSIADIANLMGDGSMPAGTIEIDYTPPEGFDPRAGAVKALEAQKRLIQAEFEKKITNIQAQINRFTALEAA
jgi:hypothetical protein